MKKFLFLAMAVVAVGYSSCKKDSAVTAKKTLNKLETGKKDTIYKNNTLLKDTIYRK